MYQIPTVWVLREIFLGTTIQLMNGMYQMFGFSGVVERSGLFLNKANEHIDIVEWEPTK